MFDLDSSYNCFVFHSFPSWEQLASSLDSVPGGDLDIKKVTLVSRRCIILALVASTPSENSSLEVILKNGYLNTVKLWMDDILSGSEGEYFHQQNTPNRSQFSS